MNQTLISGAVERPAQELPSHRPVSSVRVLRSAQELESVRDAWASWKAHRDSDMDFCVQVVFAREEVIRPHVIVIYRGDTPEAMLVGRLEATRLTSKIGYIQLPGIAARSLVFSYGGLLGNASPENCKCILRAVMSALQRGQADLAVLDHLRIDSPLYDSALHIPGVATRDHAVKPEPHSYIHVPASVEELTQGFSQGLRAEIRRKRKKLLSAFGGSVEIRSYRLPSEVDDVLPVLEKIAKTTYQWELGVGFQDTEPTRARLRFCAKKGWLRIYVLVIDGSPCAFWVGTLSNGSFVSDYNGYNPEFRDYSVGTFLLASVIEDLCKGGVKVIDFGFGQAEYKERFGNSLFTEASVRIFASTRKGLLLNAMRTSTGMIDDLARKLLVRAKLLPKIKMIWRKRLLANSPVQFISPNRK